HDLTNRSVRFHLDARFLSHLSARRLLHALTWLGCPFRKGPEVFRPAMTKQNFHVTFAPSPDTPARRNRPFRAQTAPWHQMLAAKRVERIFFEHDLRHRLFDGFAQLITALVEDRLKGHLREPAANLSEGVDGGQLYLPVRV